MNILAELKHHFRPVLREFVDHNDKVETLLELVRPAQNAQFGDYQANFPMPLGKQLGRPPREVATEISDQYQGHDLCHAPEVAGPGFINLRIRDDWLTDQLERARHDERLTVGKATDPKTYVVDFSSPNVAKPLHVGHIRSTVIGDALSRTLRFLGHHVISDNHLGDWGTQFGMIIYGYRHFADAKAYETEPLNELGRLYRFVRKLMDYHGGKVAIPQRELAIAEQRAALAKAESATLHEDAKAEKKRQKTLKKLRVDLAAAEKSLADLQENQTAIESDQAVALILSEHADINKAVLEETVKLHQGDEANQQLWAEFVPKCRDGIEEIYQRLDVRFDVELGESFYHGRLAEVVENLKEKGIAQESEGAMCVFLDGYEAPFLIQKRDGAFLYATSDLATILHRVETWNPDAILYVVGSPQSEHFDKLFLTVDQWGYGEIELNHVKFGSVLNEEGKMYKTRSGTTVGLEGLLNDAEAKALEVVTANDDAKPNGPELDEAARKHVATVVGIAALKYADLSQNRESDYVFSYDKMLALQGNTAAYMQYSYARCHGIFSRAGVTADEIRNSTTAKITIEAAAERSLALQLLRFEEALQDVIADYRPNLLTEYLFKLAKSFSSFFDQCPVVKAESDELRESRLLLCDLTARTLKTGLSLLGISVVEKM